MRFEVHAISQDHRHWENHIQCVQQQRVLDNAWLQWSWCCEILFL